MPAASGTYFFNKFLENKSLWFSRADQFEDPLEGSYTDAELERWRKVLEGQDFRGSMFDGSNLMKSLTYIDCWREGEDESLAMWDLYGKGSGSIAIKCTVGAMKKQLADIDRSVYLAKVKYLDWDDATWTTNVIDMLARKELSYKHESEVRAMITDFGHPDQTNSEARKRLGIAVPIEPSALISEVVVGPREGEWVSSLVQKIIRRYDLQLPVRASNKLKTRVWSHPSLAQK
jgi:hypothetical protein